MPLIVDAHTHLGLEEFIVKPISEEKRKKPAFRDPMENRLQSLLAQMDANGISRAIAFPYPLEEVEAIQANTYVIGAYRSYPDRIIPFALIGDDVEYWLRLGAKGFKQHAILQSPERFDLPRAYRTMAEANVPLIVHLLSRGAPPSVTDQIRAILNAAPRLKVIVAHMGRRTPNTSEGVEENLVALQGESNVYLETSTVRDPDAVRRAVEVLGEDRVVFGSDYPFNSCQDADPLSVELDIISRAHLDPEVRRKALGANILACLGIPST